jgi:RNA polymerase sigma factor (sigma-70 family)
VTMHTSPPTDADLLSRYMQTGDEGAFAALVRMHERLVIGTAARVTGDAELARDVAQQVFATLAQKAWLLTDRTSLAGWLHHASRHVALRAVRGETARQRRHELTAKENSVARESDVWPVLEDALSALLEAEREAVVMHYLQDRSYPEMAAALGVSEAAARKRVSRGLKNLGAQLRRRGFGGSAAALLAGAAALQVGTPAGVVAATVVTTAPLSLTLTTLMTHTAVKIAAVIALAAAIPIAWQSHANSELRHELAALQQQPRPAAAAPPAVRDNSALHTETAALHARLAVARRAQGDAQTALAETQAKVKQLEGEVVVSHGKIEDLARSMVKKLIPMMEATAVLEKLDGSERTAKEAELMAKMGADLMGLMPMQRLVLKLEDRPADVAHFFAIALEEAFKLPAALRPRIESALAADFEQLKTDGLIFSLRPKEHVKAWTARRAAASAEMETRVIALLPPEARNHPVLKNTEGFLNVLSIADISSLGGDAKATPQPRAGKP